MQKQTMQEFNFKIIKLFLACGNGDMKLSSALKTNEHYQLRLGNRDKLY